MENELILEDQHRPKPARLKAIVHPNKQTIDKVNIYNKAVRMLADLIPDLPPACHVEMIPLEEIEANQYNPNKMAPPESNLLRTSLEKSGVTMPILVNRLNVREKNMLLSMDIIVTNFY